MPLLDIQYPAVIKFLTERYEKSLTIRQKWKKQFAETLQLAATMKNEKGHFEEDVKKMEITLGIGVLKKQHASSTKNRLLRASFDGPIPTTTDLRKEHTIASTGLGDGASDPRLTRPDSDLTPDPIMRPVSSTEQKVLYKDFPEFGRKEYLKCRAKNPPEKRYYFAEASAFEYGWRFDDSVFGKNKPSYPSTWKLNNESKSQSGPAPDPIHYLPPKKT